MKVRQFLLVILFVVGSFRLLAQADFYSMQPLGHKYVYNSEYFEDAREIQVYQNGVDGSLRSDSILAVYVFDAQYPPTFNLFCSTFVTYAMLENPELFPCVMAISPNYNYSKRMMIDKMQSFVNSYKGGKKLYFYLANGHKDKLEEDFKPMIKRAYAIMKENERICIQYDSLNIDKHSHTIFEGYYKGLLKMTPFLHLSRL